MQATQEGLLRQSHVMGLALGSCWLGGWAPCDGKRRCKGAAEAGSENTCDPAWCCGWALEPLDLSTTFFLLLSAAVSTTGRFEIASPQPTGVSNGRQQQAVHTESRAFLAAAGQAGSFNVWTGCSNVFQQVSVCLFPNTIVQSSYLPQTD